MKQECMQRGMRVIVESKNEAGCVLLGKDESTIKGTS